MALQRGHPLTAGELAQRLEVSIRTIFRDIDALSSMGVPVYSEAGRGSGRPLHPSTACAARARSATVRYQALVPLARRFAVAGSATHAALERCLPRYPIRAQQRRASRLSRRALRAGGEGRHLVSD